MIYFVSGDLFISPAQVLVNTVNTTGVMGKGIAKTFKSLFPDMFKAYQEACEQGEIAPGVLQLFKTKNKWILNFPTKRHWRSKSRLDDIAIGLDTFVRNHESLGIHSIAFPQLGCGNGELDWESEVRPLMMEKLKSLPIEIYIHTYDSKHLPEHRDQVAFHRWLGSEPSSLPFAEFWSDLVQLASETPNYSVLLDQSYGAGGESQDDPQIAWFDGITNISLISKSDLLLLWQQLRDRGFVARSDYLDVQPLEWGRLHHLLAKLTYIGPAEFVSAGKLARSGISTAGHFRDAGSEGLQLLAYEFEEVHGTSDSRQLCLFLTNSI